MCTWLLFHIKTGNLQQISYNTDIYVIILPYFLKKLKTTAHMLNAPRKLLAWCNYELIGISGVLKEVAHK
jgi:hypothetical protein